MSEQKNRMAMDGFTAANLRTGLEPRTRPHAVDIQKGLTAANIQAALASVSKPSPAPASAPSPTPSPAAVPSGSTNSSKPK